MLTDILSILDFVPDEVYILHLYSLYMGGISVNTQSTVEIVDSSHLCM